MDTLAQRDPYDLLHLKRRIGRETCQDLGIELHGNTLSFVFHTMHGSIAFTKKRGPNKNFWIEPAGARLCLWNLHNLVKAPASPAGVGDTLVITEGEIDAASVVEAGWPVECVTSVPNGAPNKPGSGDIIPAADRQFSYLWDEDGVGLHPALARFKRFIIWTDNDQPGHILRDELAVRLGPDKCYVVPVTQGCKDANDVLVQHGIVPVRKALNEAYPLISDKLVALSRIPEAGERDRLLSGWSILDHNLVLCPPELVVVTGVPGAGKSAWTLQWLLNLTRIYGVKGAVCNLEDDMQRTRTEVTEYGRRFKDAVVPPGKRNTCKEAHDEGYDWADRYLRFVAPSVEEDDNRDLDWLHDTIAEAACRHNVRWILIDPWNEVEHLWASNINESVYLNNALRDLKRLARKFNLAIVIIAHPDKAGGRNEGIDDMTLYSIHGGATWKNKADHGIIIGRETSDGGLTGNTIVKVDKSKNHRTMGHPGAQALGFDPMTGIFRDVRR